MSRYKNAVFLLSLILLTACNLSRPGGAEEHGSIGVAVADRPEGPF